MLYIKNKNNLRNGHTINKRKKNTNTQTKNIPFKKRIKRGAHMLTHTYIKTTFLH